MKCTNKAEVWVESGFHGKMVELPCGSTGPHGVVELCQDCLAKLTQLYPQGWRHHPGDICKHGTYLNPEHDCCCADCENGVPTPSKYKCHCGYEVEFPLGWQDEAECNRCGMLINLPQTEEQRIEWLTEIDKELEEAKYTGRMIIMKQDECGEVGHFTTLEKGQENLVELILAGAKQEYPESRFWSEPERNERYWVEQQMLDDNY